MDIINVIEVVDNGVLGIKSFIVEDEQISGEVVEEAERLFIKKINENLGIGGELTAGEEEKAVEDGWWEDGSGYAINLIWSH
jgi:hypothetical protein